MILTDSLMGATYYIRSDGGTFEQCNGTADAPYHGSGMNQPCGWSHPYWALNKNDRTWRLNGGDSLIIAPGSYMIGYGAPNTDPSWCDATGPYECYLPPIPSGPDSNSPTRILGKGWDGGCSNPPELWGTERVWQVLSLEGSSNVILDCLEITDHSGCVEFHSDSSVRCDRDTFPYGDWASVGIYASDSHDVTLRNLNIHGLAGGGIHAGRLTDWVVENVRIAGNGWVGWDGDLYGDDSNSGTLLFKKWIVEWNGCAESYPDQQPNHCWAQTAGGYGDGVGTGQTGGHWIIEDSIFRYNTSDGLDLLYAREQDSQIEIRRTKSYGNAGNQIKVNGPTKVENSLIIGNCGYFDGKFFTYQVDHCRAGGGALAFSLRQGSGVSVVNSTIAGHGDTLIGAECDDASCNGTEDIIIQNNILLGYQEFLAPQDTSAYFWSDRNYHFQIDYNVIFDGKTGSYPTGRHDLVQNPLIVNANLETFDGHLQAGSPAIDSGLPVGSLSGLIPPDDLEGMSRHYGSGVDRGAYEYGASPPIVTWLNVNKGGTGSGTITSVPEGIDCGGDCSESYPPDTVVILTATPNVGSIFEGWSGGGCSGTGECVVILNVNTSVIGTFNLSNLPDLWGVWSNISKRRIGTRYRVSGNLTIYNAGTQKASRVMVRIYLSDNAVFEPSDQYMGFKTFTVNAGSSAYKILNYIATTDPQGRYFLAVIDPDQEMQESREDNNLTISSAIP